MSTSEKNNEWLEEMADMLVRSRKLEAEMRELREKHTGAAVGAIVDAATPMVAAFGPIKGATPAQLGVMAMAAYLRLVDILQELVPEGWSHEMRIYISGNKHERQNSLGLAQTGRSLMDLVEQAMRQRCEPTDR